MEYNNINPNNRMITKNDDIIFGYIGSILRHKGVHLIVKALKYIKNQKIQVKIFGKHYSHQKDYYQNIRYSIEDDSRIKLFGEFKDEELPIIMNKVDYTIAPSIWWENSPLSVLLSLAFKVPVLTNNIGGAAELINDGINGFNFEIGNPRNLASIIQKIQEKPEILNNLKNNIFRPPRIEEEGFEYGKIYFNLIKKL
ncbi:MAG: glycosyltransferase [Promethearchaeota archaeon]